MEDRYDNQPASDFIRVGTIADRCFLRNLVRFAGWKCRDVVPKCGGVWLMTRFTASPILSALRQTATTLPVFLVGFTAGALADNVNRRRLLLSTQGLILVCAAALSFLPFTGLMNAPLLLGFTFVLGLSAILSNRV